MNPIRYYLVTAQYTTKTGQTGTFSCFVNGDDRYPDPFGTVNATNETIDSLTLAVVKTIKTELANRVAILLIRSVEVDAIEDDSQFELPLEGGA